jgi:hypothetical protein
MSDKVVFFGRGMAVVSVCVAVCRRVRSLSGSQLPGSVTWSEFLANAS